MFICSEKYGNMCASVQKKCMLLHPVFALKLYTAARDPKGKKVRFSEAC